MAKQENIPLSSLELSPRLKAAYEEALVKEPIGNFRQASKEVDTGSLSALKDLSSVIKDQKKFNEKTEKVIEQNTKSLDKVDNTLLKTMQLLTDSLGVQKTIVSELGKLGRLTKTKNDKLENTLDKLSEKLNRPKDSILDKLFGGKKEDKDTSIPDFKRKIVEGMTESARPKVTPKDMVTGALGLTGRLSGLASSAYIGYEGFKAFQSVKGADELPPQNAIERWADNVDKKISGIFETIQKKLGTFKDTVIDAITPKAEISASIKEAQERVRIGKLQYQGERLTEEQFQQGFRNPLAPDPRGRGISNISEQYSGPITPQTSYTGTSVEAKSAAEKYLGRAMSDQEWDALIRATHAEAGENQTEVGMIAASILNRARDKGKDVISVLKEPNQFESVTGGPGGTPRPNYIQGPGASRLSSIQGAIQNITPSVSTKQTEFASANPAAYGSDGQRKIEERFARGFTQTGASIFNTRAPSFDKQTQGVLQSAEQFLGKSESNAQDQLQEFIGKYHTPINIRKTPWCAAFVNGVLGSQGYGGTGSNAAKSFLNYGGTVWNRANNQGDLSKAQPGDIAVFNRGGNQGHVGFIKSVSGDSVTIVGGNQSDDKSGGQVSVATRNINAPGNELLSIRRPSGESVKTAEQGEIKPVSTVSGSSVTNMPTERVSGSPVPADASSQSIRPASSVDTKPVTASVARPAESIQPPMQTNEPLIQQSTQQPQMLSQQPNLGGMMGFDPSVGGLGNMAMSADIPQSFRQMLEMTFGRDSNNHMPMR